MISRGTTYELRAPSGHPPARLLGLALFTMMATSSLVTFEPALCDVLFLPVCTLVILAGYPWVPGRLRPLLHGGVVLFLAANLWTLPWADHPIDGFRFAAITAYLVLLWMVLSSVVAVQGMRAVRLLVVGFWTAATIATVIALLARYNLIPGSEQFYVEGYNHRIKSTFKDPNVFGPFLATAIVLLIAHLLHGGRRWMPYLILLAAFSTGLLLAFSRGAYANLCVSVGALLFLEVGLVRNVRVTKRMLALTVPVFFLVAFVVPLVLASSGMKDFFEHRLSFQSYDSQRFGNQFNVLLVAAEKPWGIGPGQWEFPRYEIAVHNLYLRVLVETGWTGFLAFVSFIAGVFGCAFRGILRKTRFVGVHVAVLSIMVGTFAESVVIDTLHWRHLFFVMALSTGLDAYEDGREGIHDVR